MSYKIIRTPAFLQRHERLSAGVNTSLLVPLALGSITSYLRRNGVSIAQDDLNIKVHHDNVFSWEESQKVDDSVFLDEKRIVKYLGGSRDSDVDREVGKLISKTDFKGLKAVLFSIPDNRNSSHILMALCLARHLKKTVNPVIMVGGIFYSIDSLGHGYSDRDIDIKVMGPGEKIACEVLKELAGKGRYESCPDGKTLYGDYHSLAEPDFDGLPLELYKYRCPNGDYSFYPEGISGIMKNFDSSGVRVFPVKFIRGCPFRCIFCTSSGDNRIAAVPVPEAVDYLENMRDKYGARNFFFVSDTINFSNGYIKRLCDEIIKRKLGIQWVDCARVNKMTKELLFKMREAGCVRLVYGMETASQKLLDYIQKNIDLEEMSRVIRWTHEAGIWCGVEVISGLPYENDDDVRATIDFIKKHDGFIDRVYIEPFTVRDWSQLLLYPDKFGIKNIRRVDTYAKDRNETKTALDRYFVKYGFDEKDGLDWERKKEQIGKAFEITEHCLDQKQFPHYEEEHFLFYLYSLLGDKRKVREVYHKARKRRFDYINGRDF